MVTIAIVTVRVEVPMPFSDDEGQGLSDHLEVVLRDVVEAASEGVLAAARAHKVPLAEVARVTVTA